MIKEGAHGNLFKAFIRAIKPSNPSMIGWVSTIFYLNQIARLHLICPK
jgi:hypothetical protein